LWLVGLARSAALRSPKGGAFRAKRRAGPTTVAAHRRAASPLASAIEEVMKKLEDYRIVRVPVTEGEVLAWIISRRDIIKAVLEPEFMAFGES